MVDPNAGREPPKWIPTIAVLTIPATVGAALGVGVIDRRWALLALTFGLFIFLTLLAFWAAPTTKWGLIPLVLAAAATAFVIGAGLIGITALADKVLPGPSTTTSSTSSQRPTTTSTTFITPPPTGNTTTTT